MLDSARVSTTVTNCIGAFGAHMRHHKAVMLLVKDCVCMTSGGNWGGDWCPIVPYHLSIVTALLCKEIVASWSILLQDAVVIMASQSSCLHKYFRIAFKQTTPDNDLLLGFSVRCLQESGRCWEVWSEVGPSSPASCTILLKELNMAAKSSPTPVLLPLDKVADILGKLTRKLSEKERALARVRPFCHAFLKL